MSDAPTPQHRSVVIDADAKVSTSKWPMWVFLGAVVAFLAFSVAWFAASGDDDYEPGPMAQGFLDAMEDGGIDVELSDDELRCIDEAGEGLDPSIYDQTGFDPLGMDGAAMTEFAGTLFDDCLTSETRVTILAEGLAAEGDLDEDQATCIATEIDDTIQAAGGFTAIAEDPESMMTIVFELMGAFAGCGIDMTEMG